MRRTRAGTSKLREQCLAEHIPAERAGGLRTRSVDNMPVIDPVFIAADRAGPSRRRADHAMIQFHDVGVRSRTRIARMADQAHEDTE